METTHQIAKKIDLMRVKSIIEDDSKVEVKQPYNFDLPLMENEFKLIKKLYDGKF